jgi:YbbR domain-containing protein
VREWLTANLWLKGLSLIIGVSLWYAVAREQGAEFAFSIPLELRDIPEGLEVVEESVQQVDVRLRGPSEILRGLAPQDLSVGVDLSDAEPGESVAYLTPGDVAVPFGARVIRVTPANVQISLDRTLERTVNIIPRVLGAPAEGFELAGIELSRASVVVVGPASQVRSLEQVTTEPVSAEGLRQTFSRTVRLELEPLVRLRGNTSVDLTLKIREERMRKELSGIEVTLQPPRVNASMSPKTIRVLVEGPKSLMEQLSAEALEAHLRWEGLAAGNHRLVPIVRVINHTEPTAFHFIAVEPEAIQVELR